MNKQISSYLRLQIYAGKASPTPPVGPALGLRGLNIMEFCKAFNERTKSINNDVIIPTIITVYSDKTYTFDIKTPPTTYFIKKMLYMEKGSKEPGKNVVKKIDIKKVYELARIKKEDEHLKNLNIDSLCKMIIGTLKSMGVEIIY